jgi:hypothetical protein
MNAREVRYWIEDFQRDFLYSSRMKVRLLSRAAFLAVVAGVFALFYTAFADQLITSSPTEPTEIVASPAPSSESPSPAASETPTPTISPSTTPSTAPTTSTRASSTASPAVSDSPTVMQPAPLKNQGSLRLLAPQIVSVDPRAKNYSYPHVTLSGSEYVLACVQGVGVAIDLGRLRTNDDGLVAGAQVKGDLSNLLLVTGTPVQVQSALNSQKGLFIESAGKTISGKALVISLVALTLPSLNGDHCQVAGNSITTNFRSLSLAVTTKSGSGSLK